jgi:5'-3' exonuclease
LIKIIGGDASDSIKGISGVKETTLLKYFPELTQRQVTLKEIIESAKKQQQDRVKQKKKPLKALTNIIESNTDGIQGKQIYEINTLLVDLEIPLVNEENINKIEALKGPMGDMEKRGIKNVYGFMKRDGINEVIDTFSTSYLLPFKELIEREKKIIN